MTELYENLSDNLLCLREIFSILEKIHLMYRVFLLSFCLLLVSCGSPKESQSSLYSRQIDIVSREGYAIGKGVLYDGSRLLTVRHVASRCLEEKCQLRYQ
jgi:hypothetical protein